MKNEIQTPWENSDPLGAIVLHLFRISRYSWMNLKEVLSGTLACVRWNIWTLIVKGCANGEAEGFTPFLWVRYLISKSGRGLSESIFRLSRCLKASCSVTLQITSLIYSRSSHSATLPDTVVHGIQSPEIPEPEWSLSLKCLLRTVGASYASFYIQVHIYFRCCL